jgi:hypothetical protein
MGSRNLLSDFRQVLDRKKLSLSLHHSLRVKTTTTYGDARPLPRRVKGPQAPLHGSRMYFSGSRRSFPRDGLRQGCLLGRPQVVSTTIFAATDDRGSRATGDLFRSCLSKTGSQRLQPMAGGNGQETAVYLGAFPRRGCESALYDPSGATVPHEVSRPEIRPTGLRSRARFGCRRTLHGSQAAWESLLSGQRPILE